LLVGEIDILLETATQGFLKMHSIHSASVFVTLVANELIF